MCHVCFRSQPQELYQYSLPWRPATRRPRLISDHPFAMPNESTRFTTVMYPIVKLGSMTSISLLLLWLIRLCNDVWVRLALFSLILWPNMARWIYSYLQMRRVAALQFNLEDFSLMGIVDRWKARHRLSVIATTRSNRFVVKGHRRWCVVTVADDGRHTGDSRSSRAGDSVVHSPCRPVIEILVGTIVMDRIFTTAGSRYCDVLRFWPGQSSDWISRVVGWKVLAYRCWHHHCVGMVDWSISGDSRVTVSSSSMCVDILWIYDKLRFRSGENMTSTWRRFHQM